MDEQKRLLQNIVKGDQNSEKKLYHYFQQGVNYLLKGKLSLNNPNNRYVKKLENNILLLFIQKIRTDESVLKNGNIDQHLHKILKEEVNQEKNRRTDLIEAIKNNDRKAEKALFDIYEEDIEYNIEKGVRKLSKKGYLSLKKDSGDFLDIKQDILMELSKDLKNSKINIDILERCLYRKIQCKLTDYWKKKLIKIPEDSHGDCDSFLKREKHIDNLNLLPDTSAISPEENAAAILLRKTVELIQKCMEILYLFFSKKLSVKEISKRLALEEAEIYFRKNHGIKILSDILRLKQREIIKRLEMKKISLEKQKRCIDIIYLSFIKQNKVQEIAQQLNLAPHEVSQIKSEGINMVRSLLIAKGYQLDDFL